MARKPTPPSLKLIQGTDRPDRAPPPDMPEFDPVQKMPKAPQHLDVNGAELWNDVGTKLIDAGVLTSVDLYAFELLCVRWQNMRRFAQAAAPTTAADDMALKALFSEFGLTPAARRKVGSNDSSKKQGNAFAGRGVQNKPRPA